jgi:hypothetical protein
LLESFEIHAGKGLQLQKYTALVVNGQFYEYIQEQFQPLYPERFDERKKVKQEVLRLMYVHPKMEGAPFYKPCLTFRKHFPELYELFRLIKSVDYTYLPIILQRLESFLVLDVICKEIIRLQPHIPLFTIHDNIITTLGNEAFVKAVMEQQIEKWTGYKPKVDSKDLVPLQIAALGKIGRQVHREKLE